MRLLTSLLCKVTLSAMILTAPAMMTGNTSYDAGNGLSRYKEGSIPFFTATVIKRFVDHPTVIAMRAFPASVATAAAVTSAAATPAVTSTAVSAATPTAVSVATLALGSATGSAVASVARSAAASVARSVAASATSASGLSAKAAELRMVVRQASLIYAAMDLQDYGLDAKAFEYAWRGYHNLLKKGLVRRTTVLSICDFSQSSRNKRMYVIDVLHKKLLYRSYVAHGQNSGDEFATAFSNDVDSYKSSLGFYITRKTYVGRNGLSLRLDGVDPGYNDRAYQRQIVLHGSPYAGEKYMEDYGNLGTSLGCPALPAEMSGRIIRAVKGGSCLFIYHPTQQYLDNSAILHG